MSKPGFLRQVVSALTHEWEYRVRDTATVNQIIQQIESFCPDHGSQPTSRMICHCEIAEELKQTAEQWGTRPKR